MRINWNNADSTKRETLFCILVRRNMIFMLPLEYNAGQEPMSTSTQLPYLACVTAILQTNPFFSITFLLWRKGSPSPVMQWRQLGSVVIGQGTPTGVSFQGDSIWEKTLWQEYSGVTCSYSSAPGRRKMVYLHTLPAWNRSERPESSQGTEWAKGW